MIWTCQAPRTLPNAAEGSFWKITRFTSEKVGKPGAWNAFNSHCTSMSDGPEWNSCLNECRQSRMRPIPVGIRQFKRYGDIVLLKLLQQHLTCRQTQKTSSHVLERAFHLKNSRQLRHHLIHQICNMILCQLQSGHTLSPIKRFSPIVALLSKTCTAWANDAAWLWKGFNWVPLEQFTSSSVTQDIENPYPTG